MESYRYLSILMVFICAEYFLLPAEGAEEIPENTKLQLNQKISDYLLSFNKLKTLMSKTDKRSMYVVEKLIALSWIETLSPYLNYIRTAMPLPDDAKDLEGIVKDIKARLKAVDKSVREAALLHYIKNVHWQLADEILGLTTVKSEMYYFLPTTNTKNYHVHMKFSKKMFLRAFILNYVPEPYGKTFLLKSEEEQFNIDVDRYTTADLMSFYAE